MNRNVKKFADRIDEIKKMSFMDLINMSDDIPSDSSDSGDLDVPRRKQPERPAPEARPKPEPAAHDDDDDEPRPNARRGKDIAPFAGELMTGKTERELLGPKLFADYSSLKRIEPDMGVDEFLRGEIKDLEKHMTRLRGGDLSGAKTRLRLMKAKLEDAELVRAETPTISMSAFVSAMDRSGIAVQNVLRDDGRLSLRFEMDEKDVTRLKKLMQGFGAKPVAYGFTPPYDPWFMEGCEWRIYPSVSGRSKVYCAFSES
jgi:hypothetical protein